MGTAARLVHYLAQSQSATNAVPIILLVIHPGQPATSWIRGTELHCPDATTGLLTHLTLILGVLCPSIGSVGDTYGEDADKAAASFPVQTPTAASHGPGTFVMV